MDNPLAIMTVKVWLSIRRQRMEFERTIFAKVRKVKRQVDKFFDMKERMVKKKLAKEMFEQMRREVFGFEEEDDWEDCDEEYYSEDGEEEFKEENKGQYVIEDKEVTRKDIVNLLYFAMTTNLMHDSTRAHNRNTSKASM